MISLYILKILRFLLSENFDIGGERCTVTIGKYDKISKSLKGFENMLKYTRLLDSYTTWGFAEVCNSDYNYI